MIPRASLCNCNLQYCPLPIIYPICREHSTTVNYRRSHLVVRVRAAAVAHLVPEAVTDPLLLLLEIILRTAVLIWMIVIQRLRSSQLVGCFVLTLLVLSVAAVDHRVQVVAVPAQVDQDRLVVNRVVVNQQAATNRIRALDVNAVLFDVAILRMICSM